jgi:hypothetical protein
MSSADDYAKAYAQIKEQVTAKEMDSLWRSPLPQSVPYLPSTSTVTIPLSLGPADIIDRLLGEQHRFEVRTYTESWASIGAILHIALLDRTSKKIVRFEEDPKAFPSDRLIDALRCLR